MALKMRTAKKLAIFFTSIPREKAISILKHFSMKSMEAIASEIRSLGVIPSEVQATVFQEISEKLVEGVNPTGGEDVARNILNGVIGEEETARLLERAKPKKAKPFAALANVSAQDLATILSNEQGATAAIILGFFPPKKVAEVLAFLDEEMRQDVIVRLAQDKEADNEIVERIEEIFVQKVSTSVNPVDEKEAISAARIMWPNFSRTSTSSLKKSLWARFRRNPQNLPTRYANSCSSSRTSSRFRTRMSRRCSGKFLRTSWSSRSEARRRRYSTSS